MAARRRKHLLGELDINELELRETLRKLDAAGLAQRVQGTWRAIPLTDSAAAGEASPDEERVVVAVRDRHHLLDGGRSAPLP